MEIWQFNFRHIRAFVKTYEHGSLSAASRAVHMSQPAMTQAITKLERQFILTLFDRQSDGMRPTEGADLLYPRLKVFLDFILSSRVTHVQVRAFLALARSGSYVGAHRATGLARASLHRAVTDLENALKQTLVQRRGRRVELTDRGRSAARRYALAEAEIRSALEEVGALTGVTSGRVAIGAMPLCRARVLPDAIVAFQKKRPESEISVTEGAHTELLNPLRNGDLDFLVGALREEELGADLIQSKLFDDWPVVFARSGHPLSGSDNNDLEAISKYEWCLPPKGVPLRERWERMFKLAGIEIPHVPVECGSAITIRQILMQTDCLTVLSRDQMAVEIEADWVRVVGNTTSGMQRTIGFTYRQNWRPPRSHQEFMATLRLVL